jgi:hypothetical protein
MFMIFQERVTLAMLDFIERKIRIETKCFILHQIKGMNSFTQHVQPQLWLSQVLWFAPHVSSSSIKHAICRSVRMKKVLKLIEILRQVTVKWAVSTASLCSVLSPHFKLWRHPSPTFHVLSHEWGIFIASKI